MIYLIKHIYYMFKKQKGPRLEVCKMTLEDLIIRQEKAKYYEWKPVNLFDSNLIWTPPNTKD